MALDGASPERNLVKDNIRTELHQKLRTRGCRSMTSDQRVNVGRRYVYPDVVALCGDPTYTDENPPSLTNPELLVEVTSKEAQVVQYIRRGDEWVVRPVSGRDATLLCEAFDIDLDLSNMYALVDLTGDEAGGKELPEVHSSDEDAETPNASAN